MDLDLPFCSLVDRARTVNIQKEKTGSLPQPLPDVDSRARAAVWGTSLNVGRKHQLLSTFHCQALDEAFPFVSLFYVTESSHSPAGVKSWYRHVRPTTCPSSPARRGQAMAGTQSLPLRDWTWRKPEQEAVKSAAGLGAWVPGGAGAQRKGWFSNVFILFYLFLLK